MSESAVALYGKMLAFSRLKLNTAKLDEVKKGLAEIGSGSKRVPVILEIDGEADGLTELDLSKLIELLWDNNLSVMGVVDGKLNKRAEQLKLSIFPADGTRITRLDGLKRLAKADKNDKSKSDVSDKSDTPTTDDKKDESIIDEGVAVPANEGNLPKTDDKPVSEFSSMIHETMVRSGQAIHYMGGDLVVLNHINNGAEVATDGSLHIYGKGQGRLVAGATGDTHARIFCQNFDPSLVSVAGMYCLKEDIPTEMIGKAVQVCYSAEKGLVFYLMKP